MSYDYLIYSAPMKSIHIVVLIFTTTLDLSSSTYGLMFILGTQPRAVKKRTPRFPVSYSHKKDDRDDYIPLNKKERRSDADTNDDEVAHVAALALTQASQRGGSPQVSQSPYKRTEHGKSSPVQSWDKMVFDGS